MTAPTTLSDDVAAAEAGFARPPDEMAELCRVAARACFRRDDPSWSEVGRIVNDAADMIDHLRAEVPKWRWLVGIPAFSVHLFMGKLYLGTVVKHENSWHARTSFRADDGSDSAGWHATEAEARAALEQAARKAVGGG